VPAGSIPPQIVPSNHGMAKSLIAKSLYINSCSLQYVKRCPEDTHIYIYIYVDTLLSLVHSKSASS
jgi:hypothetical protein